MGRWENISIITGKSEDEIEAEYQAFKPDFLGRLINVNPETDAMLEERVESIFKQRYHEKIISAKASNSISINMYVMGITNLNDKLSYRRKQAIEIYKANPKKILFEGRVNEYQIEKGADDEKGADETIIKKISVDLNTKDRTETIVPFLPEGAVSITETLFVAPRDMDKEKWKKENKEYGNELPAHDYTREVFGVATIDNDVRYCKLTLRKNKATENLPEIGKTYVVKVLDITKREEVEDYTFRDSPTQTVWVEKEWNPYEEEGEEGTDGNILEDVVSHGLLLNHTKKLEELRLIAEREDTIKEENRKKRSCGEIPDYSELNYNSCMFVEVDIMDIIIEPASSNMSSRLIVSSNYYSENIDDSEGSITGWLCDQVNVDFGKDSKVVLCCYPKLGKARDDIKVRSLQLDVYGALAYPEFKTKFKPEIIDKI